MWEPIFIAAAGACGLWYHVRRSRERLEAWNEVAKARGLQIEEQSKFLIGFIKLEARDRAVTVRIEDARRKDVHTLMTASAPGPSESYGVRIERQPLFGIWEREVEIGDELFDARFFIQGPLPLVAALLDEPTRDLLTRLSNGCLEMKVIGPEVTVHLSDDLVPDILDVSLAVVRRFEQTADASRCLAHNALHDSQAGVRLLNLRLLARELPGEAVTNETLRQACADPSPQVRLQAATSLGGEGRDVLLRLAEALEDDECSAQAVSALERALPFERARDLLLTALSQHKARTARASCAGPRGRRSRRSRAAFPAPRPANCRCPGTRRGSSRWPPIQQASSRCRTPTEAV